MLRIWPSVFPLTSIMKLSPRILSCLIVCPALVHADPILTSWSTQNSGVYARVIQSGTLTTPVTVWPAAGVTNNNTGGAAQTLPVYADVQRIRYTAADVYINANGLASHTMGPSAFQVLSGTERASERPGKPDDLGC